MIIPLELIKYLGLLSNCLPSFVHITLFKKNDKITKLKFKKNSKIQLPFGFGLALARQLILSPTFPLIRYCISGQ